MPQPTQLVLPRAVTLAVVSRCGAFIRGALFVEPRAQRGILGGEFACFGVAGLPFGVQGRVFAGEVGAEPPFVCEEMGVFAAGDVEEINAAAAGGLGAAVVVV